ncbi:unnamed protein product [Arctogadus glacialis]
MEDIGSRLILDTLPPPPHNPLDTSWMRPAEGPREVGGVCCDRGRQPADRDMKGPAPGERSDGRIRLTDTSFSDKGLDIKCDNNDHSVNRRRCQPSLSLNHRSFASPHYQLTSTHQCTTEGFI